MIGEWLVGGKTRPGLNRSGHACPTKPSLRLPRKRKEKKKKKRRRRRRMEKKKKKRRRR